MNVKQIFLLFLTVSLQALLIFSVISCYIFQLSTDLNNGDEEQRNGTILCLVVTTQRYHSTRAVYVKDTWGSQCDRLIFVSDATSVKIGAINFNKTSLYTSLWAKVTESFKFAYEEHYHDFDWFLKADDDTFIIMDNLRHFLNQFHSSEPIYFGRHFVDKSDIPNGTYTFAGTINRQFYASGGAGYVLSKEALKRLYQV